MAAGLRTKWGIPLTIGAFALIAWLTLLPAPEDAEAAARSTFLCLWPCDVEGLRDLILNILLFIPLGLALRTWLDRGIAILIIVGSTVGIEFTQEHYLIGRDASLRDILTNILGGLIGIWLAETWRYLIRPTEPSARRLALLSLSAWLGIVGLTAYGMRPDLPPPPYWGQHTPELGQFAVYDGILLEASINGHPFPPGQAEDSKRFGALIASDSLRVEVKTVTGWAPEAVAPIVSVFNGEQRQVMVLGQAEHDLVFVRRTGLEAAELASQNLVLPDFPGSAPGDTVRITAGVQDGAMYIRAEGSRGSAETRTLLSAGWLWTGLNPFYRRIPPTAWIFTALWLGGLMLPGGYYLGRGLPRVWGLAWLLVPVTFGLLVATTLAGLRVAVASEWVGSLGGGVLGWAIGRWSPNRRPGDPGKRTPISRRG